MSQRPSQNSRRDFLKNSSAFVAGSVASGVAATSLGIARAAHVSGSDEIKLGLIGCGGRGTGAAGQAMNTKGATKLVAVADAFEDRLQGALKQLKKHGEKVDVPPERQFVGFDAYQKVLEADIDLVLIATPPGFRPLHFEAAVNAGKHIFMEKPLAVDARGVRKVLEVNRKAKQDKLAVAVGLQRHHEQRYQETIQRLRDGAIGDLLSARVYWNGGGVWTRPRQDGQTEMEYQMRNWYYFNWLCGDHIVEQHIHNLDVINWLKQAYPVSAHGLGGRQTRTGKEHGQIFDHHAVEYTYADGTRMFSQCAHLPDCWSSVSEHVQGTAGSSDISGAKILDAGGKETWKFGRGGGDGWQQEHHDLFADLRAGKIPNEADYGAMSTMTSILGRMVTYSGQEITMKDALASKLVVSPVEDYHSFQDTPPVVPDAEGRYPVPVPGKTKTV
jgi:predicted dehydrogenase